MKDNLETLLEVIYNKLSLKELQLLEENIKSRVFNKIQERINKQKWLMIPTKSLKEVIDKA